jgi:hypothetical protein
MPFLRLEEHGREQGDDATFFRRLPRSLGVQAVGRRDHGMADVRQLKRRQTRTQSIPKTGGSNPAARVTRRLGGKSPKF